MHIPHKLFVTLFVLLTIASPNHAQTKALYFGKLVDGRGNVVTKGGRIVAADAEKEVAGY